MDGKIFFDTTILLYLYAADKPEKQTASIKVVQECQFPTISTQTLSELANTLDRNMQLKWHVIDAVLTEIEQAFTVETITQPMLHKACRLAEIYRYSYYNSIAIATALLSGCTLLLTEHIEHNQLIEHQLRIMNPFLAESMRTVIPSGKVVS